jgi:hypothetical protein
LEETNTFLPLSLSLSFSPAPSLFLPLSLSKFVSPPKNRGEGTYIYIGFELIDDLQSERVDCMNPLVLSLSLSLSLSHFYFISTFLDENLIFQIQKPPKKKIFFFFVFGHKIKEIKKSGKIR